MRWWEIAALVLALAAILGTPVAAFAYNSWLHSSHDGREVTLVAAHGTWGPEVVRVKQGEKVRLRLTSHDVKHGFALAGYGISTTDVYPGRYIIVEFVADKPGAFPFVCVVQCAGNHANMRGELVVEGTGSQQPLVELP